MITPESRNGSPIVYVPPCLNLYVQQRHRSACIFAQFSISYQCKKGSIFYIFEVDPLSCHIKVDSRQSRFFNVFRPINTILIDRLVQPQKVSNCLASRHQSSPLGQPSSTNRPTIGRLHFLVGRISVASGLTVDRGLYDFLASKLVHIIRTIIMIIWASWQIKMFFEVSGQVQLDCTVTEDNYGAKALISNVAHLFVHFLLKICPRKRGNKLVQVEGMWRHQDTWGQKHTIDYNNLTRIHKSVQRVTVLASRGSAEQCQTVTQGTICLSVPYTSDRFLFLHTFVPTLKLTTILITLKYATYSWQPFCFWRHSLTLCARWLGTKLPNVHYNQC